MTLQKKYEFSYTMFLDGETAFFEFKLPGLPYPDIFGTCVLNISKQEIDNFGKIAVDIYFDDLTVFPKRFYIFGKYSFPVFSPGIKF